MINTPQKHLEEFSNLLRLTICPDNEKRKECESRLSSINRDTLITLLLQVLLNGNDVELLEIASLMLRQTVDRLTDFHQISAPLLTNLKNTMPQLCLQQTNSRLRRKYVDIVCSLATMCYDSESVRWSEVNAFFYECLVTSNHDVGKEIGFRIIESAPCILRSFNDDVVNNIFKVITSTLSSDPVANQSLLIDSARSYSSLVVELPLKRTAKYLGEPINAIVHLLRNCGESKVLTTLLTELIVLTECRPKSMVNYINVLLEATLALLNSQHTVEEVRGEAFECIVILAENCKRSFRVSAKELLPSIVDVFVRHLTLLNDDPQWAFSIKEDGGNEEDDLATIAETSLDRLTCSLGGKLVLPIIMERVSPLLESELWQHRCAAITAIGCIAEGALKVLKPHLPQVLNALVKFVKDKNPRVVFSTINTLGQFCVDFPGFIQTHHHAEVFLAVFYVAETYVDLPRLQAHAVCCFINLLTGCPSNIVSLYSDRFFQCLYVIFVRSVHDFNKPGVPLVLENVLFSLSDLAETLGSSFTKYYRSISQELIALVRSFATTPHIKYYISSLEALSSILRAVGRNECIHELESVLSILKSFEFRGPNTGDSTTNHQLEYLEIMAIIAEVFGDSFSPILPTLIPLLLEMCCAPIENQVINSSLSKLDLNSDKNGFTKAFSAHTDAVKDKTDACRVLKKLYKSVGAALDPHMEQICEVMIGNFCNSFDEDIQSSSCEMFPLLLKAAQRKSENVALHFWAKIFEALYGRVIKHDGLFFCDKVFDSLRVCLKVVSYHGMTSDILFRIVQMENIELLRLIKETDGRASSGLFNNHDDDSDDDSSSIDEDEDENVLSSIHDLDRLLFKMLGANYFPYFNQNFETIIKLSECPDPSFRSWALCILSNLIEFCPTESLQVSGRLFERVKSLLTDPLSENVRHFAYFFVAITAEFASQQYQSFLSFALPVLVSAITEKDSREDENATSTANAIAAVGKIMKFSPNLILPFDPAILTWINWLPVFEDEVDFIMGYLIELVQTKFEVISAPNNNHLFKALDSLAAMIPYASDATDKALSLLTQLRTHVPESFEFWFTNLNPTLKGIVESARSSSQ